MNIKSLIFAESKELTLEKMGKLYDEAKELDSKVLVDAGWYATAIKHYCGTCEQWFKTASVAAHKRFKHK